MESYDATDSFRFIFCTTNQSGIIKYIEVIENVDDYRSKTAFHVLRSMMLNEKCCLHLHSTRFEVIHIIYLCTQSESR